MAAEIEAFSPGGNEGGLSDDEAEQLKVASFIHSHGGERRGSVSGAPVTMDMVSNWKGPPFYPKSPEESRRIKVCIKEKPALQVLFGHLSEADVDGVVGGFFLRTVEVGEVVITQGADGDYFYIVDSGQYDIFVQRSRDVPAERVMIAGPGASFGELALMYNVPRAASVCCAQRGGLWCLERDCFQMMLITAENSKHAEYESFLSQIPILASLNKFELGKMSDLLSEELFDGGEDIVTQGDETDSVFFLYEGECKAYISGEYGEVEVKHYSVHGQYFGEIALVSKQPRRATVRACGGGCVVLRLSSEDVDLSVGNMGERLLANIATYQQYEAFCNSSA